MAEKRYPLINRNIIQNLLEEDFLGTRVYADELYSKIEEYKESNTLEPFYIALTGTWGSGKTLIVDTALEKCHDSEYLKIKYDAWKYSGDSFRRTFLTSIAENNGIKNHKLNVKKHLDRLYKDKLIEGHSLIENILMIRDQNFKLSNKQVIISTIFLFLIIFAIVFFFDGDIYKLIGLLGFPTVAIYIINMLFKKTQLAYPKYFSPEQFYEAVNEILTDKKIRKYTKVIFIDNVDRCDEDDLKQTFASIKGLLEIKEKIIYIIPFDEDAIRKIYADGYHGYINKMFDSKININICNEQDILDYLYELRSKFHLYDNILTNTVIEIISTETYTTPREIIDVCNNYITDYNIHILKNNLDPRKITERQLNFLIKYSIIKNKYSNFFQEVIKNLTLYSKIERIVLTNDYSSSQNEISSFSNKNFVNNNLYHFLRITKSITTDDLDSYFSISDTKDFNLSSEQTRKISAELYDEIINDIMTLDLKEKYLKFLSKNLAINLRDKMWEIHFKTRFTLLMILVERKIINYNEVNFIKTIFMNENFYNAVIDERILDIGQVIDFMYGNFEEYKEYLEKLLLKINIVSEDIIPKQEKRDFLNRAWEKYPKNDISDELKEFYIAYSKKIINENDWQSKNRIGILNPNLLNYMHKDDINFILNNMNINETDIVNLVIDKYSKSIELILDETIFMNLILTLNKLINDAEQYIESIVKILEIIKNKGTEESYAKHLDKINNDYTGINDYRVFNHINIIYFELNNDISAFRNFLISKNSQDELKIHFRNIKKIKNSESNYITNFYLEYLSNLTEKDFLDYQNDICNFYKRNPIIQEKIIEILMKKEPIFSKLILEGFNTKSDISVISNYIQNILKNLKSYEEKIEFLFLFEQNHEMLSDFIYEVNSLQKLYRIYSLISNEKKEAKKQIIRKIKTIVENNTVLTIEDRHLVSIIQKDSTIPNRTRQFIISQIEEKTENNEEKFQTNS